MTIDAGAVDPRMTRRQFVRLAALGSLGLGGAAMLQLEADYVTPERPANVFGGVFTLEHVSQYAFGVPVHVPEAQCWLVNVDPRFEHGVAQGSGLYALHDRCPHRGVLLPWNPDFRFRAIREPEDGWFRCPAFGCTFTQSGARVYGPAPNSMYTFPVSFDGRGHVIVDTTGGRYQWMHRDDSGVTHPDLPLASA